MNCRNVRKLIDEADNVDILPFNATAHTDSCPDCRRLADQRRELSALLSSTERVSAPANFDTVLRMKLDERLAKRWFPFTLPSFSLRFSAAAAMIVCLIVGGDLALKHQSAQVPAGLNAENGGSTKNLKVYKTQEVEPAPRPEPPSPVVPRRVDRQNTLVAIRLRPRGASSIRTVSHMDPTAEAAALFLLQGADSQSRLAIPYVTVGGQQPIVNVSSRSQAGQQDVRVAF